MKLAFVKRADGLLEALDDESLRALQHVPCGWHFEVKFDGDAQRQRTLRQNAALHKYCELLAEKLNSAGFEMKKFFEVKSVDVPWDMQRVKDCIWRPVQQAVTKKDSTRDCSTAEYPKIYSIVSRHISENLGVNQEWPSNR